MIHMWLYKYGYVINVHPHTRHLNLPLNTALATDVSSRNAHSDTTYSWEIYHNQTTFKNMLYKAYNKIIIIINLQMYATCAPQMFPFTTE